MANSREEITVRAGLPQKWHCEVTLFRVDGIFRADVEVHYDSVFHTRLGLSELGASKADAMDRVIENVDRFIEGYLRDHHGRPPH